MKRARLLSIKDWTLSLHSPVACHTPFPPLSLHFDGYSTSNGPQPFPPMLISRRNPHPVPVGAGWYWLTRPLIRIAPVIIWNQQNRPTTPFSTSTMHTWKLHRHDFPHHHAHNYQSVLLYPYNTRLARWLRPPRFDSWFWTGNSCCGHCCCGNIPYIHPFRRSRPIWYCIHLLAGLWPRRDCPNSRRCWNMRRRRLHIVRLRRWGSWRVASWSVYKWRLEWKGWSDEAMNCRVRELGTERYPGIEAMDDDKDGKKHRMDMRDALYIQLKSWPIDKKQQCTKGWPLLSVKWWRKCSHHGRRL